MNRMPIDPIDGEHQRPGQDLAKYEAPTIRVFTEEELLAMLGPAQLYTGSLPFEF